MIAPASFQREWITRHAGEIGSRNPVMLEKAIVALQLLGHLVDHLVNQQFHVDEARLAAAKAACAAAWIQQRPAIRIEELRFDMDRIAELRNRQFETPWTPLNRLKGANPEAFHYWWHAWKLLVG